MFQKTLFRFDSDIKAGPEDFERVRCLLRDWLGEKTRSEIEDASDDDNAYHIIQTDSYSYEIISAREGAHRGYAVRFSHPCAEMPGRRWFVTALLTANDAKVNIKVDLSATAPKYIREQPVSIPRFLRSISDEFGMIGSTSESRFIFAKTNNDARALAAMIDRVDVTPLIVVSLGNGDTELADAPINMSRLAKKAHPFAKTFLVTPHVSEILIDILGKKNAVYDGAIRIYMRNETGDHSPYLLKDRVSDKAGAEQWTMSHLMQHSVNLFKTPIPFDTLRKAVLRKTRAKIKPPTPRLLSPPTQEQTVLTTPVETPAFVIAPALNLDPAEELLIVQPPAETPENLDELLQDALAEKRQLSQDVEVALSLAAQAEEDSRLLRLENERLQNELVIGARVNTLGFTVHDIPEWAEKYYSHSLTLGGKALKGFRKSTITNPATIERLQRCVAILGSEYWAMKHGVPGMKEAFVAAIRGLGGVANTNSWTKKAGISHQYVEEHAIDTPEGRKMLDLHLKWGTSREPDAMFRLYYVSALVAGRVVLGAGPGHLTNRMS